MNIERTPLPGIGLSHRFVTRDHHQVCVVSHRNGDRTLSIYDADEPDELRGTVTLTQEEAHQLADLLHSTVVVDHYLDPEGNATRQDVGRLRVTAASPYDGRPVADIARRDGTTIVAVIRDGQVISDPDPHFVLSNRDTIVAVGAPDDVSALGRTLAPDGT